MPAPHRAWRQTCLAFTCITALTFFQPLPILAGGKDRGDTGGQSTSSGESSGGGALGAGSDNSTTSTASSDGSGTSAGTDSSGSGTASQSDGDSGSATAADADTSVSVGVSANSDGTVEATATGTAGGTGSATLGGESANAGTLSTATAYARSGDEPYATTSTSSGTTATAIAGKNASVTADGTTVTTNFNGKKGYSIAYANDGSYSAATVMGLNASAYSGSYGDGGALTKKDVRAIVNSSVRVGATASPYSASAYAEAGANAVGATVFGRSAASSTSKAQASLSLWGRSTSVNGNRNVSIRTNFGSRRCDERTFVNSRWITCTR